MFKVILIETHNRCNRTCWFCKFGQERQDPECTRMPMSTVERIIANLKDLDYRGRVSWFWINEPLMDKRIYDVLRLTREGLPKAFLSLVTNGDILTEDIYRKLRDSGLDALGVSIYDDVVFEKISKMRTGPRLVAIDQREVSFENRGGNVKRNPADFQEARIRVVGESCARPFEMMVVNAKGKVALCCADLYTDVEMGDVKEHRLEAIWQNARFRRYRAALHKAGRKGLALCDDCSHDGGASRLYYPLRTSPKGPALF